MRDLFWKVIVCLSAAAPVFGADSDGDGIPDEFDVCPDTPAGVLVDPHGRPAVDYNHDCAVNGLDISGFMQQLMTPPGGPAVTTFALESPTREISGYFGVAVAGVPDVDGDGLTDLLVGAKLENPIGSPNDAGRAHLFSGKTGTTLRSFASPNEQSDGRFGWGVGGVPDLNGDGHGDVIIGAPLENPVGGPPDAGQAYVFSGATGSYLYTLNSPTPKQGGLFGFSVSGIADIDGDGAGDIIVGAWHESPPGNPSSAGRAHVYSGASGDLLYTLASPNQTVGGYFGVSVSSVYDVNGDGIDDIVVGAPGDPPSGPVAAGRAYIFSGVDGSLLQTLASSNPEPLGNFGISVSGVPDIDGDGRGDVIVGASQESSSGGHDFAGRAYLISGATGQVIHVLESPNAQDFSSFGEASAGVADIDGDGWGDVVIGARDENPGGSPSNSGRAYVFSGATGALIRELVSPNAEAFGQFGYAVAGLQDASCDRRGDVVVVGLFENPPPNPTDSGMVYLFNLADSDVDCVADTHDVCPGTPAGWPVDLHGRPAADFNGDCLVTPEDIAGFVDLLLGL
jgi:hypothetical protein